MNKKETEVEIPLKEDQTRTIACAQSVRLLEQKNGVTGDVQNSAEQSEQQNEKTHPLAAKAQAVRRRVQSMRNGVNEIHKRVQIREQCHKICTVRFLKDRLPILKWLPNYRREDLQGDLIAGLTVGLTVIPQSLAYAKIAKLPPQYGLYSAFIGTFVYALLGTSRDVTFGPTAVMSLLTAEFCSHISEDARLAIMLTFICGVVQIIMGLLNIGFLVDYISHPVINSFTTAAAITIACSQLKRWLGLTIDSRDFIGQLTEIAYNIKSTRIPDFVLGLTCMILLGCMKRMKDLKFGKAENESRIIKIIKYIIWIVSTARNAIIVFGASILAAILTWNNFDNVFKLTRNITEGIPPIRVPEFSFMDGNHTYTFRENMKLMGIGSVIVPLLGVIESIAIGRKHKYNIDGTQELLAIGASNLLGSFFSSYPVTASFSRSAVNAQSGVKTPGGGFYTGVLVLLALAFLTPCFYYIPDAALAGVIIMAVLDMIDFHMIPKLWKVKKSELLPWFTAFFISLFFGFEFGIILGVAVSLILLLHPWSRPKIQVQEIDFKELQADEGSGYKAVVVTPRMGLRFPGVEHLQDKLMDLAFLDENKNAIVLNMQYISDTDYTTLQGMQQLRDDFIRLNGKLILANVQAHVRRNLIRSKIEFEMTDSVDEALSIISAEYGKAEVNQANTSNNRTDFTSTDCTSKLTEHGSVVIELTTDHGGIIEHLPPSYLHATDILTQNNEQDVQSAAVVSENINNVTCSAAPATECADDINKPSHNV